MSVDDHGISGDRQFPTTSWSVILNAQSASPEDHVRHLARLAEIYWRPVYSFIRRAWKRSHDDAKDLTQEFFATAVFERNLIAGYARGKGGFRSFLRTAIVRFMVDVDRETSAKKRGGELKIASLEGLGPTAFEALADDSSRSPEQLFDIAWKEAVMKEAMGLLRQRLTADGRASEFEAFKRYDFEGGSAHLTYEQLAEATGLRLPQVRHALVHAREAFRQVVTEIVSAYVTDAAELKSELRALFGL